MDSILHPKSKIVAFNITALKESQRARMTETKFCIIEKWGMALQLKKISAGDLADSVKRATYLDTETGTYKVDEKKKETAIVGKAIVGVDMKDLDVLENEEAGIISAILQKVLEWSGFGTELNLIDHWDEEKKSSN